jgi:hypothetical protein
VTVLKSASLVVDSSPILATGGASSRELWRAFQLYLIYRPVRALKWLNQTLIFQIHCRPVTPEVAGSSPVAPASNFNGLAEGMVCLSTLTKPAPREDRWLLLLRDRRGALRAARIGSNTLSRRVTPGFVHEACPLCGKSARGLISPGPPAGRKIAVRGLCG